MVIPSPEWVAKDHPEAEKFIQFESSSYSMNNDDYPRHIQNFWLSIEPRMFLGEGWKVVCVPKDFDTQ